MQKLLLFAITTLMVFAAQIAVFAQKIDLDVGDALYFTGTQTSTFSIKDKTIRTVQKDGTMELAKSEAVSCDGDLCKFNIGIVLLRKGDESVPIQTYVRLALEDGSSVGNVILFDPNQVMQKQTYPVRLKVGMNKVILSIDPDKKTTETDESNNSTIAYFNVTKSVVKIGKGGDTGKSSVGKTPVKVEYKPIIPSVIRVLPKGNNNLSLSLLGAKTQTSGRKEYTEVSFIINDWQSVPNNLFAAAPELPACGVNKNSSRTWLEIRNADDDSYIYGYCSLTSNQSLKSFSFSVPKSTPPPMHVYVVLKDRKINKVMKSNCVNAWSGIACEK